MHSSDEKPITVFDVADKAGVSRGTVDRVIYGRGRVSEATRKKVRAAIAELHYVPNANASSLATRREHLFSVLIPDFRPGEYWEEINKGFLDAARSFSTGNIRLAPHYYDIMSEESFVRECAKILEEKPAGVILNARFDHDVIGFAHQLEKLDIPYAFVDSKVDDLNYTLYYGADAYKSGALGAWLLTNRMEPKEILLVRVERDAAHKVDPNRARRHGFTDFIEDHQPGCRIHTLFIKPDDEAGTMRTLSDFFAEHPHIHHLAMTHSRISLLGGFFRTHPDSHRVVVGYDDLPGNLECLREGLVDTLITCHISNQSYQALRCFADCIIHKKLPPMRNNFIHMDILTRMNIDNY